MPCILVIAPAVCKWNFRMASNLQAMFRLIIFQHWLDFAVVEDSLCNINCNPDLSSAFHPLKSLVYLFWNNFGVSWKATNDWTEILPSALLEWTRSLHPCRGTHTLQVTAGKVPPLSIVESINLNSDKNHLGSLRDTDVCPLSR